NSQSCHLEVRGNLFDAFPRRGVNYSRPAGSRDDPANLVELLFLRTGVKNAQRQIGTVKAGDEDSRAAQSQLFDYVGPYLRRGGSRQGDHLRTAQALDRLAQPEIVGPEVMPPIRYAVGFVNRKEFHLHVLQRVHEGLVAKSLGRDIDKL